MKDVKYDLAIIGAGILGISHALHALNKGLKVALFERHQKAQSSTVRNFGQVVPSGMNTKWQLYGRKSLEIYKNIQSKSDIGVKQNGSIYIASNEEEIQLIEELQAINKVNDYKSVLLTKEACIEKYPNLNHDYCKAGLFFPDELSVDPTIMIHRVLEYLKLNQNFSFFPNTLIKEIDSTSDSCLIIDSLNNSYKASISIVCSGAEFEQLYFKEFYESDIELVKLQMLRLKPQSEIKIPGNILTGLTIRRYESFYDCPSFKSIKENEEKNSFWKNWGIHILFKQEADGSIILGDSHEYADVKQKDEIDFYLRDSISEYFVLEAKKIMHLEHWNIDNQWLGVYSQCKENDIYYKIIDNKVHIITGIGGKGMTASPGYAFENINKIFGF